MHPYFIVVYAKMTVRTSPTCFIDTVMMTATMIMIMKVMTFMKVMVMMKFYSFMMTMFFVSTGHSWTREIQNHYNGLLSQCNGLCTHV